MKVLIGTGLFFAGFVVYCGIQLLRHSKDPRESDGDLYEED